MSLTLTKFTQEVDVGSGLDVTYFAVFKATDGRELKLPISKDASETLIAFMAEKSEPEDASSIIKRAAEDEMVEEEDQQFGSEFGGDFEDGNVEAYDEDSEVPESEEEVPSL